MNRYHNSRFSEALDMISRTDLLVRWDKLTEDFNKLGDKNAVRFLKMYRFLIMDANSVDVDKAYNIIHDVEGNME